MLVDAVDAETVEHVKGTHPLRVALCKVVVHCYDVYTVACEGVEEYGKCSHKSLSFTGCHLGNLAFVENDTAEQLYIVVYHVPYHLVSAG